ncbi:hypothetical protein N0V88_003880 [Collariella sp. IMI 366227]|nr:hypothetical protein N0V88_003880 [Collariella sp. IMI 366227]
MFVDLGYEAKACAKLKNDSRDDEFLISRLILLTTYGTTINLATMIEKYQLADSIIQNFLLINAFINLDLSTPTAKTALYPSAHPTRVADRLLALLGLSMKFYPDTNLEQTVTPLICVLSSLYEHAPTLDIPSSSTSTTNNNPNSEDVRAFIRTALLPTAEDRKTVLGQGTTLPAQLLRNWTNPLAPQFRSAIAHLYFDMSAKDPAQFVENVGYGYASGFLFDNKIEVPEGVMKGHGAGGQRPVNPITGQFLDREKVPDLPEMTMEEKEREAERLFVLFERLKQTGVMSVQNPVETAMQEGRIQELSDSDDED